MTTHRADHQDMSDLSRLLDDVYSSGPAAAKPQPAAPAPAAAQPAAAPPVPAPPVPEAPVAQDDTDDWGSESSMEAAFADWVPGPGAEASTTERELFALDGVPSAPAPAPVDHAPAHPAPEVPSVPEAPSVFEHVFAADDVDTGERSALADLFDETRAADELGDAFTAAAGDLDVSAEPGDDALDDLSDAFTAVDELGDFGDLAQPPAPAAVAAGPAPVAPDSFEDVFGDVAPVTAAPAPVGSDSFDEVFGDLVPAAEVAPAPEPAPAPMAPVSAAPSGDSFLQALDDIDGARRPGQLQTRATAAVATVAPAYEPPATLAEALLDAPDAPPADLTEVVHQEAEWPHAGIAAEVPLPAEARPALTSWSRADDDLLPARSRGRSRRRR